MPNKSKQKKRLASVRKGAISQHKTKLHQPTKSAILNQQQIENKPDLLNINPKDSRTEMQKPLPVKDNPKEAVKVTAGHAIDNATGVKEEDNHELDDITNTHELLKLEDVVKLWNEIWSIPVPQCKCSGKKKRNPDNTQ